MALTITRRGLADVVAARVALAVLTIGVIVIGGDSNVLARESTPGVTKQATAAGSATDKTTTTVTRVKKKAPRRTTTTVHTPAAPGQPEAVTVTKQTGERTFL